MIYVQCVNITKCGRDRRHQTSPETENKTVVMFVCVLQRPS